MTFLYPYFLLLLFVPFIFYFTSKKAQKNTLWSKICDAHLLPYLIVPISGSGTKFYQRLMLFCWIVGCICLSGPALETKIQTAAAQSGLVVVVDMSPAMRDETAFQMVRKLYDLADYKKDTTIGLVLADSKAYVALPMTLDKNVFKNILPDLKENIMPSIGQNYSAGIEKAAQLLKQSGFQNGQILLLTAGAEDPLDLKKAIEKSPYYVSVIGLGDLDNAKPIILPNGRFFGADKPILLSLDGLKEALGQRYMRATLDETDLKKLLQSDYIENIEKSTNEVMQYQNLGVYGVLLLLPFVALLFRKGVLFVFLFCFLPFSAQAGFWWRQEQELYQTQMQGIADFNVGQYEQAANAFESIADTDIDALYNLGNTFAYMGQFDKAIQTYEKVLSLDPDYSDAAYNLAYLKEHLPPPPPQEQQGQGGQSDENQEQSAEQQKDTSAAQGEQKEKKSSEQSENQADNAKGKQDLATEDKQTAGENQKENLASPDENTKKEEKGTEVADILTPAAQKEKEWMDKVPFNAGSVLRYRLQRQYQEQK